MLLLEGEVRALRCLLAQHCVHHGRATGYMLVAWIHYKYFPFGSGKANPFHRDTD